MSQRSAHRANRTGPENPLHASKPRRGGRNPCKQSEKKTLTHPFAKKVLSLNLDLLLDAVCVNASSHLWTPMVRTCFGLLLGWSSVVELEPSLESTGPSRSTIASFNTLISTFEFWFSLTSFSQASCEALRFPLNIPYNSVSLSIRFAFKSAISKFAFSSLANSLASPKLASNFICSNNSWVLVIRIVLWISSSWLFLFS